MLASCKKEKYLVKDYLIDLATISGLSESEDIDECFMVLLEWGVVEREDYELKDSELTKEYLKTTLSRLTESSVDELVAFSSINESNVHTAIVKAVKLINSKQFENDYSFKLKDEIETVEEISEELEDGYYYSQSDKEYYSVTDGKSRKADYDDIYEKFKLSGSQNIDFTGSEVEMNGEEIESSYVNNDYELLSSKSSVFSIKGYRVSYSLNSGGISFHISKSVKDGLNTYADVTISNISPTYNYEYDDDGVKKAYFKIDYESTSKYGISRAEYKKKYLDLKNVDTSDFKTLVNTVLKDKKDMEEASIPICTIKTPIPNVPAAYFNIDVLLRIYAGGKAEIVLSDDSTIGFETKNGKIRLIKDIERDDDLVLRASLKTTLGLNFNISATDYRLMDVELDGGIKAEIKSTLHLYETEETEESDLEYDELEELSEDNDDIEVCGDLTLRWVLDLKFNTAGTLLYKYGLNYTKEFMDDDDQVFGNLHHIENGQFVEKCTRVKRTTYKVKGVTFNLTKITLDTYSIVLKKGETYEIDAAVPTGYSKTDLTYSYEGNVVSLKDNAVTAIKSGSAKIRIATYDGLYETYLNVLVSYE